MGISPKDIDLVAIGGTFQELELEIVRRGGKIFISKPEYFTVRCNMSSIGPCDIALARCDGIYSDGRRPDSVSLAESIIQDLSRRDFTMNAIAKNIETGELTDPFNGQEDIKNKLVRCVGNPFDRFNEDRLRVFRAFRFAITKGLAIEGQTWLAMREVCQMGNAFAATSHERIREEINKAFRANTSQTFRMLLDLGLVHVLDEKGIWLVSTTEKR